MATHAPIALPLALLAALACALGPACDDRDPSHAPAPPRPRARVPALVPADGAPGSLADAGTEDPEDAGGEQPRSLSGPLAACIARVRAATPPELAAALDALEYPAVSEDSCRLGLAVSSRDVGLCTDVRLSLVREVCVMRAAVAAGTPSVCPHVPPDRGRDPVCVALAVRSPGLCAAARRADLPRCLAIARGAPAQCGALDPLLRPRCRGDVEALAPVLGRLNGAPLTAGTAHLRVQFGGGRGPDGGGIVREYALDLAARGVFADETGTLYLVDPQRGWPGETASGLGSERPIVGIAVDPPRRPGAGRLVDLRVVMPDGVVLAPALGARADVHVTQVPRGRGSDVEFAVSVDALGPGVVARVELTVRTFVRDVVEPREIGRE